MSRRRILLGVLPFLVVAAVAFHWVKFNFTDSLPRGFYWIHHGRQPTRGELVAFCLEGQAARFAKERGYPPPGTCPERLMPLLKRAVAVAGDDVDLSPAGLLVNGQVLAGRPPTADSLGRPLTPLFGHHHLEAGFVWAIGEAAHSFDSRYYGAISSEQILGTVTPLLLFEPRRHD